MALFSYSLLIKGWFISSALLLLIMAAVFWNMLQLINRTNKRLSLYFKQMSANDYTLRFPEKKQGLGYGELHKELNTLAELVHQLEHKHQKGKGLMAAIMNDISTGILILDSKERVHLSNPMAREFLNIRSEIDQSQLSKRAPFFYKVLSELRKNHRAHIEVSNGGEVQKWLIHHKNILQDNGQFELFMLHNLQEQTENTEAEVTEKLMHTLTHEIMNSVSPITSLVDTLQLQLANIQGENGAIQIETEDFQDLQTAATIIQRRSYGLIEFVKRYSLLARLPQLKPEFVNGQVWIEEIKSLMSSQLKEQNVKLEVNSTSSDLKFRADYQLLLQVLINLIKNAAEALEGQNDGIITLNMNKGDGYNYITVSDNAGGVPLEIRQNIFLPFFSTKDKGSGIGLSLSRKIIQAHGGRLYLKSHKDGSEFRIELAD